MMTCSTPLSMNEKAKLHNDIVKLKNIRYKNNEKENPKATEAELNKMIVNDFKDMGINMVTLRNQPSIKVNRENINAKNITNVRIYDIEAFKGGYKILYVTPGTNTAKVVRVASDGRTVAGKYDVKKLDDAKTKLNEANMDRTSVKEKIVDTGSNKSTPANPTKSEPVQKTFKFNAEQKGKNDEESQIEINEANTEIINASLINDSSKSLEILDMLFELDDTKVSSEDKEMLRESLTEITDMNRKVIPDMIQTINKESTRNYGETILEGDKKGVYIGISGGAQTAGNAMSSGEMYVHELYHAGLEYAQLYRRQAMVNTMKDIHKVYRDFMKVVTVEDFMPPIGTGGNRTEERMIAKSRIEYLRDPKRGVNEFIVMSKTNSVVQKVLNEKVTVTGSKLTGESLFQKLLSYIEIIYNNIYLIARKDAKGSTGTVAMAKYIRELSEVNNVALDSIKKKNILMESAGKMLDFANKLTAKQIEKIIDKIKKISGIKDEAKFNKALKDYEMNSANYSKVEKLKHIMKLAINFVTDGSISNVGAFETLLEITGMKPEGTIQQLFRRFRDSDELEAAVESIGLQTGKIEGETETALAEQSELIKELFDNNLNSEDSKALTQVVLDIELESMINKDSPESMTEQIKIMKESLESEEKLDENILELEKQIKGAFANKGTQNFILHQVEGLGEYMVTKSADDSQLTNAYMILGMSDGTIMKSIIMEKNIDMKPHRAYIDKLATLHGIKKTDKGTRDRVAKLIDKDADAIIKLMNYDKLARNQTKMASKSLTDYEINRVKGMHEKIGSSYITYKVGLKADKDRLEKENYKPSDDATYNELFDLYINSSFTEPGWRAESMNITNDGQHINSYLNIMKEHHIGKNENEFTTENINKATNLVKANLKVKSRQVFSSFDDMRKNNYKPNMKAGMRPVFAVNGHGEMFVSDMDISVNKALLENQTHTKNEVDAVLAKTYSKAISLEKAKKNNILLLDLLQHDMDNNYKDSEEFKGLGDKNLMSYTKIGPNEDSKLNKEIWGVIPRYMKLEIMKRHYLNTNREIAKIAKEVGMYEDKSINTDEVAKYEMELINLNQNVDASIKDVMNANKNLNEALKKNLEKFMDKKIEKEGYYEMKEEYRAISEKVDKISKKDPYIAVRRNMIYHVFGNREASLLKHGDNKTKNVLVTMAKTIDMFIRHLAKITKVNIVVRDLSVLTMNILSNVILGTLQGRDPITEIKMQLEGAFALSRYKKDNLEAKKLDIKIKAGNHTEADKNRLSELVQGIKTNPVKPLIDAGLYTSSTEDLSNQDLHKETYLDAKTEELLNKLPSGVKNTLDVLYITKHTPAFRALLITMQYSDFAARYARYHHLISQGVSPKDATKQVLDNQINYGWGHGKTLQWLNDRFIVAFTKFVEGIQKVVGRTAVEKPFNVAMAIAAGGMAYEDGPLADTLISRDLTNMFYGGVPSIYEVLSRAPAAISIARGDF